MQCTPEPHVYHEKGQRCYDDCSDSGYSGLFHTPQSVSGDSSTQCLSPVEFSETRKENLGLPVTPKTREQTAFGGKGSRGTPRSSALSWCETPRLHRREAPLRHRLLMCKPSADVRADKTRSPCTSRAEASISRRSDHWLSASFGSLDGESGQLEQDAPLCVRKRRLLFTQVRTSTLEDGKLHPAYLSSFERRVSLSGADISASVSADHINGEAPCFNTSQPAPSKETSPSPLSAAAANSVLRTPSSSHTPKYIRSVCEDSGFSSLALDKSKDSSVDHDGSFMELLLSASRGNCETPSVAEVKRRSRLQRQNRLSTLKEGGSQSEEDPAERRLHQHHSRSAEDEVFADVATPSSSMCATSMASVKENSGTPLRAESMTPFSAASSVVTPLRTTPADLSLTPALQLVHAMCQQKAQMFVGQSPSLKDQLKSTAALAETPVAFRTTMPLAGLIGRKMGLRKVDILTELKKRNLRHVLSMILSHLSAESIYMCGQVCRRWNGIIQQDKRASFRRRSHLSSVEASLERGAVGHVPDAETRLAVLKRSALKTVQAQSRTSSFCTPQSASSTLTPSQLSASSSGSSSKREKFLEVAKTLFIDECLRPCPRCEHPARCHAVKQEGVCSRDDCAFHFCTSCLCAFHGSKECGSQSVGRRKKDILVPGSAQSRRNIRRL